MNFNASLKLSEKYATCPKCGSANIGNGEGTLIIEDHTFERSCKCGWKVLLYENGQPVVNLHVKAWATIGPRKIYELHDEKGYYGYVSVNELQRMGYVKRIDHTKKAVEFLNTLDGLKWVNRNRFFSVT